MPANVASTDELFLRLGPGELGSGVVQYGDSHNRELSEELCSRLSREIGRPVIYIAIVERAIAPGHWKQQLDPPRPRSGRASAPIRCESPARETNGSP